MRKRCDDAENTDFLTACRQPFAQVAQDRHHAMNPPLSGRGVRARFKEHDSKSCVPRGTVGSNPTLSATSLTANRRFTNGLATIAGLPAEFRRSAEYRRFSLVRIRADIGESGRR